MHHPLSLVPCPPTPFSFPTGFGGLHRLDDFSTTLHPCLQRGLAVSLRYCVFVSFPAAAVPDLCPLPWLRTTPPPGFSFPAYARTRRLASCTHPFRSWPPFPIPISVPVPAWYRAPRALSHGACATRHDRPALRFLTSPSPFSLLTSNPLPFSLSVPRPAHLTI